MKLQTGSFVMELDRIAWSFHWGRSSLEFLWDARAYREPDDPWFVSRRVDNDRWRTGRRTFIGRLMIVSYTHRPVRVE